MSYVLTLTNGTILTLVPDNSIDTTSTSLTLFGQGYVTYGADLDENLIYMLENFSNATPPAKPLAGQLWYDSANNTLYLRTIAGVWAPLVLQSGNIATEITVEDGNGNAAELDGTGSLYLQNSSGTPCINFLINYASPLSTGTTMASICLGSNGNLVINPGLTVNGPISTNQSVTSNTIQTNVATVSGALSAGNLTVAGSSTFSGGTLVIDSLVQVFNSIDVETNVTAFNAISVATLLGTDSATMTKDGFLTLTRSEVQTSGSTDGPVINFNDGTANQGYIKLINYGTTGWNTGAPGNNPYVLQLVNGLDVQGNQLITGNLTVQGNIIGGGAYLPLAGGTLTGNLNISGANLSLIDNNTPSLVLSGTSQSGTTNGSAYISFIVDNVGAEIRHYINATGNHILAVGTGIGSAFGGAISFNMTGGSLASFIPFIQVQNMEIWGQNSSAPLSLYNHSGQVTGGSIPALMLCDQGASSGTNFGTNYYAIGMGLEGNNNGLSGGSNNYQLIWGEYNGITGVRVNDLMALNAATGNLNVSGTIGASGLIVSGDIGADGNLTVNGNIVVGVSPQIEISGSSFQNSLGGTNSSGYQYFPGGLIMQWGYAASSHGDSGDNGAVVTFPISFPNACINVQATNSVLASSNHINASIIDNTSFHLSNTILSGFTDLAYWFAIGY